MKLMTLFGGGREWEFIRKTIQIFISNADSPTHHAGLKKKV